MLRTACLTMLRSMSDQPLRVAIVGAGDVAHRHYLPALESMAPHVRLAAVIDPRDGAGEALVRAAETWSPGASVHRDLGEMLRAETLDGVIDLTPAPMHGRTNRLIVEDGVACYSEKPIASTVAEADELIALAGERGAVLMCAPGSAVSV